LAPAHNFSAAAALASDASDHAAQMRMAGSAVAARHAGTAQAEAEAAIQGAVGMVQAAVAQVAGERTQAPQLAAEAAAARQGDSVD
jgi:hypothetical protein